MKTYDKVRFILETFPETRNSDKDLIWKFAQSKNCVFAGAISYQQFMRIPSFESITRARRKVQEYHPHLQAVKKIKEAREAKQQRFPAWIYDK